MREHGKQLLKQNTESDNNVMMDAGRNVERFRFGHGEKWVALLYKQYRMLMMVSNLFHSFSDKQFQNPVYR